MLKSLEQKKILWIFEEEYKKDPETFIQRVSEKIRTPYKNLDLPYSNEQTLSNKVIFASDTNWSDYFDVFVFLKEKGYDFLSEYSSSLTATYSKSSGDNYREVKKYDIVPFFHLLKNKPEYEDVVCDYFKENSSERILNAFKESGEDIYRLINVYNLNKIKDVIPKLNIEKQVDVLNKVFKGNVANSSSSEIRKKQFDDLPDKERKIFLSNVLFEVDNSLLEIKLRKTNEYKLLTIKSLLNEIKDSLTLEEKCDFVKRVPQSLYYKEVANILGVRFSNKDFIGTPWDRLIDFSLENRKKANDSGSEVMWGERVGFELDTPWLSIVSEIKNKPNSIFNNRKHRDKDFNFAIASLHIYSNKSSDFFKENAKNIMMRFCSSEVGLDKFHKSFYNTPEMLDYMVDEFNNNIGFRQAMRGKKLFIEKFSELIPRLNLTLLKNEIFYKDISTKEIKFLNVDNLCLFYKNNVDFLSDIKKLPEDKQLQLLTDFCKSHDDISPSFIQHRLDLNEISDFFSNFEDAFVYKIANSIDVEANAKICENMRTVIMKKKIEFQLSSVGEDLISSDSSTNFKL